MAYGKTAETNQVRCKAISVEPPLTPKGSDGTQVTGRRPSARANAHKRRKLSAKTLCERGYNATGSTNKNVSKAHRISGQGHHQEGARDGMSERLRQGPRLKNKREIGGRLRKGKDQAERPGLSQTHCHSKRAGSLMAPRESSGRGRSLTRRRILQAQKTTC